MKRSRFIGIFLAAVMIFATMGSVTTAKAAGFDIAPNNEAVYEVFPGQTTHVKLPMMATESMYLTSIRVLPREGQPFTISNLEITEYNGSKAPNIMNVAPNMMYYLDFDVTVEDSAVVGYYSVDVAGSGQIWSSLGEDSGESLLNTTMMVFQLHVPYELSAPQLVVKNVIYDPDSVVPGNAFDMTLNIGNEGERKAVSTYLSIDYDSTVTGIVPDYVVEIQKVGDLNAFASTSIKLPIKILPTAEQGLKEITVNLTGKDLAGNSVTTTRTIYLYIGEAGVLPGEPFLSLTTDENYKVLTPDTNDVIRVKLTNEGDESAHNVKLTVESGLGTESGITKAFTTDSITIDNIKKGETRIVEIPVVVAKNLTAGLKNLKIKVEYTNNENVVRKPAEIDMYVQGPEELQDDVTVRNIVTITEVSQSPQRPQAGERISMTFKVNNEGTHTIKDFKIQGTGLSDTNFIPVNSEPYQYIGDIDAGKSKTVTVSFVVGEKITEGLNTLGLAYTYTDANEAAQTGEVSLYVLNVENNLGAAIGKPKLIISNYETSEAELKAGSVFDLTFSVKNTHQSKSANNIKVTITQAEGVFAPDAGSNIFYIDTIAAGEEAQQTIRLKTMAKAATGDYDLVVKVEYEYDDMSDVDAEKGGVSEENTLKLHAVENYRPAIENLYIDAWDAVTVGNAVDLYFEFYNMGQSLLGNVYVTIEGDFELANNSEMYYVGSVNGYSSEPVSPSIIPLVAGEAVGKVIVHFEDSNGDEVTMEQEFTQYIEDVAVWNPDDYVDPGYSDYEEVEPEAEPIMSLTVFLIIQAGVLLVGILVTYKVKISLAKKKLLKELEKED